jgi:hypothetical protein
MGLNTHKDVLDAAKGYADGKLAAVAHDSTLTGSGIISDPLSAVGGGGGLSSLFQKDEASGPFNTSTAAWETVYTKNFVLSEDAIYEVEVHFSAKSSVAMLDSGQGCVRVLANNVSMTPKPISKGSSIIPTLSNTQGGPRHIIKKYLNLNRIDGLTIAIQGWGAGTGSNIFAFDDILITLRRAPS